MAATSSRAARVKTARKMTRAGTLRMATTAPTDVCTTTANTRDDDRGEVAASLASHAWGSWPPGSLTRVVFRAAPMARRGGSGSAV